MTEYIRIDKDSIIYLSTEQIFWINGSVIPASAELIEELAEKVVDIRQRSGTQREDEEQWNKWGPGGYGHGMAIGGCYSVWSLD